ncbi:hypothetical protein [Planomicrobium sp. CPCC 101079]|uniref:hypothetical protein n=1 Tax=Planomicrobium sp. CPCC 101079 TaxID=2599618 RepID=UPI0011B3CBC5|nr:hypothetical protein [Planomicrobium sp. CPCC 101079]TWT09050.1 hypothetical protein FQV28_05290 [Planomicrobium sp. CPCC 101079]
MNPDCLHPMCLDGGKDGARHRVSTSCLGTGAQAGGKPLAPASLRCFVAKALPERPSFNAFPAGKRSAEIHSGRQDRVRSARARGKRPAEAEMPVALL